MRPEGVADGHPVEIPDPGAQVLGGRFSIFHPALLVVAGQPDAGPPVRVAQRREAGKQALRGE